MGPHPGLGHSLAELPICLVCVSLQARLLPKESLLPTYAQPRPLGLHGYEARHGGLETVKDVAGGEGHEVVHEGRQGEDKQEPFVLGFAVWRRERTVSGAQGGWDSLPLIQPSCRVSTQPGPTLGQPLPSQTAGLVGSSP